MAMENDALARRQLTVLADVIATLRNAGCAPVVLKGLPLSLRLYGDIAIRASVDFDVFVPLAHRAGAERVLRAAAWDVVEGAAPWTQTLSHTVGTERFYLEVHSSLLDLNLHHLRPPAPMAEEVRVGSASLPVHRDAMLPAYLAAHAAKHMPAALLYDLDFRTLWDALPEDERADAVTTAKAAGLGEYLDWMVRRSAAITAAAAGESAALQRLGIATTGRSTAHAVFRDILLAHSPLAALRAVGAWVWPPHLRDSPAVFAQRCATRLRGPWARHLRKQRAYGAKPGRRSVR
jgi:hypothetical protein